MRGLRKQVILKGVISAGYEFVGWVDLTTFVSSEGLGAQKFIIHFNLKVCFWSFSNLILH
jgi:hypothetical protein